MFYIKFYLKLEQKELFFLHTKYIIRIKKGYTYVPKKGSTCTDVTYDPLIKKKIRNIFNKSKRGGHIIHTQEKI